MAISILDVLPLEERQRLVEIHQTLNDLIPIAEQLVSEGYPLTDQLTSLNTRRTWNDQMLKTFQVQIPPNM